MADVEVLLLGPVAIRVGGIEIPVASTPQRVLLARLGLGAGRVVHDDRLVELLWTGDPPSGAVANLQSYISKLRRRLGREAVVREASGYRLASPPVDVDVVRFDRLISTSRKEGVPASERLTSLQEALALWRGEPFADLPDPAAFAAEDVWLRGLHREAEARWFDACVCTGSAEAVLAQLERATRAAPTDQELHLCLVRALAAVGRPADALREASGFRSRMIDETGLSPSLALAALEQEVLAGALASDANVPSAATGPSSGVLPARHAPRPAADRFVGRSRELDELRAWTREHALVTVVGPGGAGKTRLVLEHIASSATEGSVLFLSLAALSPGEDLRPHLADALGIRRATTGLDDAMFDALGEGGRVLVVDNCEHLLGETRRLVELLRDRCPQLPVIATSRRPLGASGERVLRLSALRRQEQIELFVDRARQLRPDFDTLGVRQAVVEEIGDLVDGLPLGLELAARRESVFGLRQLRDRLRAAVDVVEPASGEERWGLVATIEWSYDLLSAPARRLLDRLTVFAGPVGLAGIEHIGAPDPNLAIALAELVEASLVIVDHEREPPRYRVLHVVRVVCARHLSEADRRDVETAHRSWVLEGLDRAWTVHEDRSPVAASFVREHAAEILTVLDALDWSCTPAATAVQLAVIVSDDPQVSLLSRLRALGDHADGARDDVDAQLLRVASAIAAWLVGEYDDARGALVEAHATLVGRHPLAWVPAFLAVTVEMFSGRRDEVERCTHTLLSYPGVPVWAVATAVSCAALANLYDGRREHAGAWLDEHRVPIAVMDGVDGFVAFTRAEIEAEVDPARALALYGDAIRQSEGAGNLYGRDVARVARLALLARHADIRGAAAEAGPLLQQLRANGMWPQTWIVVRVIAELLVAFDDCQNAALLLHAVQRQPSAPPLFTTDRERYDALQRTIDERTDDAFRAALPASAARLSRGDVVEVARRALAVARR